MKSIFSLSIIGAIVFCACPNPNPVRPFVLDEPDKILMSFYTDFDISNIDSISIQPNDPQFADSITPVMHEVQAKEYDTKKELWHFQIMDSLSQYFNYTIRIKSDSTYKEYNVTDIQLGRHGTYLETQPDAYYWEIAQYKLDGKIFEDNCIYLTNESVFRELHSWQR